MTRLQMILWGIAIGLGIVVAFVLYRERQIFQEGFQDAGEELAPAPEDISGARPVGLTNPAITMTAEGLVLNKKPDTPVLPPEEAAAKQVCPLTVGANFYEAAQIDALKKDDKGYEEKVAKIRGVAEGLRRDFVTYKCEQYGYVLKPLVTAAAAEAAAEVPGPTA
jgi:hypothetical protein